MTDFKMLAQGSKHFFFIHFGVIKKNLVSSEKSESVSHETLVCFDEAFLMPGRDPSRT